MGPNRGDIVVFLHRVWIVIEERGRSVIVECVEDPLRRLWIDADCLALDGDGDWAVSGSVDALDTALRRALRKRGGWNAWSLLSLSLRESRSDLVALSLLLVGALGAVPVTTRDIWHELSPYTKTGAVTEIACGCITASSRPSCRCHQGGHVRRWVESLWG